MNSELLVKKHIKYIERHLAFLPSSHQEHDPNKIAIVFYSIVGLASLGEDVSKKYESSKEWLYQHYTQVQLKSGKVSGFIGSATMDVKDMPTMSLPNTLFALLIILCLKDHTFFDNHVDRESLFRFVGKCQLESVGSFVSSLDISGNGHSSPIDANDLRFCYIAVAILYILGCRSVEEFNKHIDVNKLLRYTLSQSCVNGGFGQFDEPHAGYTSCALSMLQLLGLLDKTSPDFQRKTVSWVLQRQVSAEGCMGLMKPYEYYDEKDSGGFQGRENKFADTCYAFWCLNSLQILTKDFKSLCQTDLVTDYLLKRTQNSLLGGFSKNDEDNPDIYHTCLGVAALNITEDLFDGVLCIPKDISQYWFK